jgi:hypothetical protein
MITLHLDPEAQSACAVRELNAVDGAVGNEIPAAAPVNYLVLGEILPAYRLIVNLGAGVAADRSVVECAETPNPLACYGVILGRR